MLDAMDSDTKLNFRLNKDDCLLIPDNYNLCYNRLKSMHFKLSKTPGRSCSKAD